MLLRRRRRRRGPSTAGRDPAPRGPRVAAGAPRDGARHGVHVARGVRRRLTPSRMSMYRRCPTKRQLHATQPQRPPTLPRRQRGVLVPRSGKSVRSREEEERRSLQKKPAARPSRAGARRVHEGAARRLARAACFSVSRDRLVGGYRDAPERERLDGPCFFCLSSSLGADGPAMNRRPFKPGG